MKKLLALTASLLMAASFVSCGDDDGGNGKSSGKSGSDKAANDYAESYYSPNGAKTCLTLWYPDEYIEELKDNDKWEYEIEDFNDDTRDYLEEYKINIKEVKKGDELTDDQLMAAEAYFDDYYDCDVTASKGYEYEIKYEEIYLEDDDKETDTEKICVVKLDEGWKIVGYGADDLEDEYA